VHGKIRNIKAARSIFKPLATSQKNASAHLSTFVFPDTRGQRKKQKSLNLYHRTRNLKKWLILTKKTLNIFNGHHNRNLMHGSDNLL